MWGPNVTISGKVVTLHVAPLLVGANYTVQIDPTAFVSKVGVYYAGTTEDDWTFVTTGAVNPTATLFPAPRSHNVSVTAQPTLTFSEWVRKGVGNLVLVNETDGSVMTWAVEDPAVVLVGNVVTLNVALTELGAYYVHVDPTAFESFAGLKYAGILDNDDWNFALAAAFTVQAAGLDASAVIGVWVDGVNYTAQLTSAVDGDGVAYSVLQHVAAVPGPHWVAVRVLGGLSTAGAILTVRTKAQPALAASGSTATSEPSSLFRFAECGSTDDTPPASGWNAVGSACSNAPPAAFLLSGAQWEWPGGCNVASPSCYWLRVDTIVRVVPPQATLFPANASVAAPDTTSLQLSFDTGGVPEFIEKGVGTFVVVDESACNQVTIDINSTLVSVAGAVVTVTVPALPAGHWFHVELVPNGLHTYSDIAFPGWAVPGCVEGLHCYPSYWTFTTDSSAPLTATLDPLNTATDAAVGRTTLSLVFSECPNRGEAAVLRAAGRVSEAASAQVPVRS